MLVILLKRNLKIAEKKFRIKSFLSPNLENNLNVITLILSFGAKQKTEILVLMSFFKNSTQRKK